MRFLRIAVCLGCLLSTRAGQARLPDASVRAEILKRYLRPSPVLVFAETSWGAVSGTACAAGTVAAAVDEMNDTRGSRPYVLGVLGACAAVSFASYALPSDYQDRVVGGAFWGAAGGAAIAIVHFSDYATPANRVTAFAFAGNLIAFGGIGLVDAALSRPVSLRTLDGDARQLDAWGASVGERELGRMERRLRRVQANSRRLWLVGSTQLVAGMVALSPALVRGTSRSDRELAHLAGGLLASYAATSFVLAAFAPRRYDDYARELGTVRLAPLGPAGSLGVSLGATW